VRGLVNLCVVGLLIAGLVSLFTAYPIVTFFRTNPRNLAIDNNVQVNATGQVAVLPGLPAMLDVDTPARAEARTGWDGHAYELVFSDEFNAEGRSFYPGDEPYWEAIDCGTV
jgi:beta-glucan synthesis-associated protein KRE6